MSEPAEASVDLATVRKMYEEWRQGVAKSTLEARYLGKSSSHGKAFSSLVRKRLGIETERRSGMVAENERLRALLRSNGIDPDSAPRSG